jgi:hypothetical protein
MDYGTLACLFKFVQALRNITGVRFWTGVFFTISVQRSVASAERIKHSALKAFRSSVDLLRTSASWRMNSVSKASRSGW